MAWQILKRASAARDLGELAVVQYWAEAHRLADYREWPGVVKAGVSV